MERKTLFPASGRKVRDPLRKDHLPEEGREVEMSPYWVRRLECGDAVDSKPANDVAESRHASASHSEEPKKKKG